MIQNWQALKDDEKKRDIFFLRAKIIASVRDFFCREGFLEVETPNMVRLPGMEPYLDPIKVALPFGGIKRDAYLTTSPEYAMKKILAAGFPKIFQICKSFRGGEEADRLHNPEFTILEWYRTEADYKDVMADTENLFLHILRSIFPEKPGAEENLIVYQNKKIDLSLPWPRLTVREAFEKYAKMNLDDNLTLEAMAVSAKAKGYVVSQDDRFDDIFFKIFLNEIEPNFDQARPVILYDWPAQLAALSRRKTDDPRYAERFEVYAGGLELGNAFSELSDSDEQRDRLTEERDLRKKIGKEIYDIDEDFLLAIRDMPKSGGIAMGVDRMVMLFTDAKSMEEVSFFPAGQIFEN
jgi:lysyl-tRNA synthetase class 2